MEAKITPAGHRAFLVDLDGRERELVPKRLANRMIALGWLVMMIVGGVSQYRLTERGRHALRGAR